MTVVRESFDRSFTSVAVAPGSTPPLESVTVPLNCPVRVCAPAAPLQARTASITVTIVAIFFRSMRSASSPRGARINSYCVGFCPHAPADPQVVNCVVRKTMAGLTSVWAE